MFSYGDDSYTWLGQYSRDETRTTRDFGEMERIIQEANNFGGDRSDEGRTSVIGVEHQAGYDASGSAVYVC